MTEIDWDKVPRRGGVYCIYDLDETPVYVGYASESDTRHLVSRLREHFTQQNSSVVAHGRIDLLDVWYVDIWTTSEWKLAEDQLILEYDPVFNRGDPTPEAEPIDTESPDVTLQVCDEDERKTRLQPPNRIRSKMDHIQRMVDSDQVAFDSLTRGKKKRKESAQRAAEYHFSILESAMESYYEISD